MVPSIKLGIDDQKRGLYFSVAPISLSIVPLSIVFGKLDE